MENLLAVFVSVDTPRLGGVYLRTQQPFRL